MPRGGPGSAPKLRLPANWPRIASALCWSFYDGRWWVVDHGESLDDMQVSAASRQNATARGIPGDPRRGTRPRAPIPGGRFVATTRNGNPQLEWDTAHDPE